MDLSGLLTLLEEDADLHALVGALGSAQAPVGVALPRAARAASLAALQRSLGRPLLVVTGSPELRPFHEELQAWCGPEAEVLLLPEPEGLPYERLPAHPAVAGERLATLARLSQTGGTRDASGEPALTLTPSAGSGQTLSQRER
ncbi:MAG: hypothetical protein HYY05_00785, partial [Chloroflexi bacterium]|nr:hypothetical protein [Chloroflexota bacterium]